MRIAIFSDVHGNLTALEAVLADIEQQQPDLTVFAGDLCLMGPRPAECLRLVRSMGLPAVVGNTDEFIAGGGRPPERMSAIIPWTQDQLTAGEVEWLGSRPFGMTLSPTADAADDLRIVHANPNDVNAIIYPPIDYQMARYNNEVRQSDEALRPLLAGLRAAVLAFGHLHLPTIRVLDGLTLVNVSSVSNPGDGDARAKYALLSYAGGRWSAEHHRVAYDMSAEADAFRERQPPGWQEAIASIESDGYYYPQKI